MSDCVVAENLPAENPNSSKGFRETHLQRVKLLGKNRVELFINFALTTRKLKA